MHPHRTYSFESKRITDHYVRIYLKTPSNQFMRGPAQWALERTFRQKGVLSAEVNKITRSILVHHDGRFDITLALRPGKALPAEIPQQLLSNGFRRLKFNRWGERVSHWEMLHEIKGQFRVQHPLLLRRSQLCSRLEQALGRTPGVLEYKANPMTSAVWVKFEPAKIKKESLLETLDALVRNPSPKEKKEDTKKIGNFEFSSASFAMSLFFPESLLLTLPAVIATGMPIFKKAWEAVKRKKVKVDILDTVVIGGSLAAQQFPIAAFMVWIVSLADKIQNSTSQTTGKLLEDIFGSQPRFAWVKEGGKERQVALADLKKGDEIVVHAGEAVPNDGEVVSGEGLVDQSALTGESQPADKHKGEKVFSCTTLVSGELCVRVEKTGGDTIAGQIQKMIAQSASYKTKAQSIGETIADKAVLPTLGLGAVALATGGPSTALAVVNCDFGTGIRVAAPTLLLSHLITLARHGIVVKNGGALDKLRQADVFIFDKTGTLTAEVPEVTQVLPMAKKYGCDEILGYAAAAEQYVSHPIAKAILAKAEQAHLRLPPREQSNNHIGLGVEVILNGAKIRVGSLKYMYREGIRIPGPAQEHLAELKEAGQGAVLVAVNESLAGLCALKTSARRDAYEIVRYLKSQGIKETVLMSGDQEHVTKAIASELGIERYHAEVLPHQKADFVKRYKAEGKLVAMVGDGVNDGPALSCADIAISLHGASEIAMDTAQILFLDGHFEKIPFLFDSARKFHAGVWSSFRLIAIPNSICIAGALANFWGLGTSLIMNNGFNLIATLKSLTPLWALQPSPEKNLYGKGV